MLEAAKNPLKLFYCYAEDLPAAYRHTRLHINTHIQEALDHADAADESYTKNWIEQLERELADAQKEQGNERHAIKAIGQLLRDLPKMNKLCTPLEYAALLARGAIESAQLARELEKASERTLDSLALIYLHGCLCFIHEQLLQQAIKLAGEATSEVPSLLTLSYLPAWLEIYERGAVSQALRYLVPKKLPLSAFIHGCYQIPEEEQKHLISKQKHLDPEKNLIVVNKGTRPKNTDQTLVGAFEIHGYLQEESTHRLLLDCKELSLDTYHYLITLIPTLKGEDISKKGETFGEHLLNTRIIPDRFLHLLHAAVMELGPTFVQCLVFCGTPLPLIMDIPGHEGLNKELPYKPLDLTKDITFPCTVSDIIANFQKEYEQDDRKLKIVGMP